MSEWIYYAVFDPPESTAEQPANVLRQRPGASRFDAEILSAREGWKENDLLDRIVLGRSDKEVTQITPEQAARVARRNARAQNISTIPEDLRPFLPVEE